MDIRFRSIDQWTYPSHEGRRRSAYTFRASWSSTLELLGSELEKLNASDAVIECFLRPGDIRMDGFPRGDAKVPVHPGVAVHFDSDVGHLRYATDAYQTYQANIRAIALSLEALRAVDRYGATEGREQYRGFAALPPGTPMPAVGASMTLDEAAELVVVQGRHWLALTAEEIARGKASAISDESYRRELYADAIKSVHPDTAGGIGDPALLARLQAAKRVLEAHDSKGGG